MVLGMAGVVYAVLLFFLLRRDTPGNHRRISVPEFSTVMRSPGFLLLATAFAAASVANWLIYTWLPLLLTERFHLTLAQAGFTATFYIQVASYAGMLAIGFLSDRLALRWGRARVWVQIAGLLLSAPFLLILSRTNSYVLVIPVLLMIGIFRPFFDVNAMPVLRQLVPGNLSSTGYGILNMVGCFGGGIAALAAGYFKNTAGLAAAYQWAAIVLIAGAVPLIMLSRNRLSDQ
jgi:sugar phosphate permease